jgi:hypothetical protein
MNHFLGVGPLLRATERSMKGLLTEAEASLTPLREAEP